MKRMITKKMRDSFKVSSLDRLIWYMKNCTNRESHERITTAEHFRLAEKQRILILRRTVK